MYKSFAESAVVIALKVLQSSEIRIAIHSANASTASTALVSQGCIVGPPALARIVFYMYKTFAESDAAFIRVNVASPSKLHKPPHMSTLKDASLAHRHLPKWSSMCIKASQKAPY
jgi:hypothetical protein